MLSFLRKCTAAGAMAVALAGFSMIPTARAEDKPAVETKKGSVSGTVVDKDGKAVSGIEVGLFKPQPRQGGQAGNGGARGGRNGAANQAAVAEDPKPGEPAPAPGRGNRQRPEALFKTTTDAEGKFTIKDVPVGDYAAMVRSDKGVARERVTVTADSTATLSLKLQDRPQRGAGGAGGGGNRPNRNAQ